MSEQSSFFKNVLVFSAQISALWFVLLTLTGSVSTTDHIKTQKWDVIADGQLNSQNMCAKLERQGYRCLLKNYPAEAQFPYHTHDVDKLDGIMECVVTFGMYGEEVRMEPGDTVFVPKMVPHYAKIHPGKDCMFFDGSRYHDTI